MTFRRGGKGGIIYFRGRPFSSVSQFNYLGVTFQTSGNVFTIHVKERANAAIKAMSDIKNARNLSLKTAIRLFHLKVAPVISYGLENIWPYLKYIHLAHSICTSERTALRRRAETAVTPANNSRIKELMTTLNGKKEEIWSDFFSTDAMIYRDWMQGSYELRHIMMRFSVHGFHHKASAKDIMSCGAGKDQHRLQNSAGVTETELKPCTLCTFLLLLKKDIISLEKPLR